MRAAPACGCTLAGQRRPAAAALFTSVRVLGPPSRVSLLRRRVGQVPARHRGHCCIWPPRCSSGGAQPSGSLRAGEGQLGSFAETLRAALQAAWELQRRWLRTVLVRVALGVALACALATAAANIWGRPAINRRLLPIAQQQAAQLLQREVELGAVRWLSPAGLTGLVPLVRLGPVSVGPGPVEQSSAAIQHVAVGLDPMQSALQRRVVLTFKAKGAEVRLKQASNFSWFGYPDDTTPSARNFVPGLPPPPGGSGSEGSCPPRGSAGGGSSSTHGSSETGPSGAGSDQQPTEHSSASTERRAQELLQALLEQAMLARWQQQQRSLADASFDVGGVPDVMLASSASAACGGDLLQSAPTPMPPGGGGLGVQRAAAPHHESGSSSSTGTAGSAEGSSGRQQLVEALNRLQQLSAAPRHALQRERAAPDVARRHRPAPGDVGAAEHVVSDAPGGQSRSEVFLQHGATGKSSASDALARASDPATSMPNAVPRSPSSSGSRSALLLNSGLKPLAAPPGRLFTAATGKALLVKPGSSERSLQAVAARTAAVAAEESGVDAASSTAGETLPSPAAGVHASPSPTARAQQAVLERINALPGLTTAPWLSDLRQRVEQQHHALEAADTPAAAAAADEVAADDAASSTGAPLPSLAVQQLRAIPAAVAPEACSVSAAVDPERRAAYANAVVDPATLRRKGGSATLPWSQQRPPARALIGSKLGGASMPRADGAAGGVDVGDVADGTSSAASAEDEAPPQLVHLAKHAAPHGECSDEAAAGAAAPPATKQQQRPHAVQLVHPGYFAAPAGPSYTPAPPEALIDARYRRGSWRALLHDARAALLSQLKLPGIAVGKIELARATLLADIHGEALPRRFDNVVVTALLGKDYDSLDITITADPHERDPASVKCTMPNPHGHRHLRHVTGRAAIRSHERVLSEPAGVAPSASSARTSIKPSGGRLRVHIQAAGIATYSVPPEVPGGRTPTMTVTVAGQDLHAPLVERILELPMDIHEGRANGELRIHCHDAASWQFPEFFGRVNVRDADFHFWDATDDIMDASLDLLFERTRLYLHNTKGRFGSVPMSLTGDLDLNPLTGSYRLTATVPGVEANQLRATLGVRPTPFPVAGAVAGTLHVTGPLEKPIFSGTAMVVRPSEEMLADCEPTTALAALGSEPAAVGAYDKVPFQSAGLVFTLDTSTETMTLHAMHAKPVGGGQLHGSGRMWVAPQAEMDPTAVSVRAEGEDLPVEALARRYLPPGAALPPSIVLGRANLSATMRGSHLAPIIDVNFLLPDSPASGTAQLAREATRFTLSSPSVDASGTVHLQPPSFEAVKEAVTQAQATALATPMPTGCEATISLKGLDLVPLVSDEAALRQLAQQSGQPVRLKLNGCARVSGKVQQTGASQDSSRAPAWAFDGSLGLDSVRLNQLKLFQKLAGSVHASKAAVSVHAKGLRANETLDLHMTLPLLPDGQPTAVASTAAAAEPGSTPGEAGAPFGNDEVTPAATQGGGSTLQMRCGQLALAANLDAAGSQVDLKVQNLRLDELELASLRGELGEASCSLNFESQAGRGKLNLLAPRYSGLRGESLSGGFRWERDVVRLEKVVLTQMRSRYEVQGEYVIPPNTPLPASAADLALQPQAQAAAPAGRWRVQVSVPGADMQEIIPAARLLQNAASLSPTDYERAKGDFMAALGSASVRAGELNSQLRSLAEQLVPAPEGRGSIAGSGGHDGRAGSGSAVGSTTSSQLHVPGLQDLRGQWSGSVQAFGGGGGATSCDFDIRGQAWQWGSHGLDSLIASGSYHSEEGLHLQEFVFKSGDAKLLVRGSLLGEHQDATVLLTDFPMATLRPLFRAVPALAHAAPAVSAQRPLPVASPRPVGMLTNVLGRAGSRLDTDADSPINGLLYVSGNLSGSKDHPTGEVAVRLYDAAVGNTRLAQAQARARVNEQQLAFNVEVVPAEGHRQSGHVRAVGVIPLAADDATMPAIEGSSSSRSVGARVAAPPQQLDVRLSVRDSGMALLTTLTPDVRWQQGSADVAVHVTGNTEHPSMTGAATISRATVECPLLRFPLTNLSAEVHASDNRLTVEALDARSGKRGHIRVRGSLPLHHAPTAGGSGGQAPPSQQQLAADISGLELRARNTYSGQFDGAITITDSVAQPTVGGSMRFSRGVVLLIPQGEANTTAVAGGGASDTLLSASALEQPLGRGAVARAFEVLTGRGSGEGPLAAQVEAAVRHEVEAVEALVEEAGAQRLALDRLRISLGPDLRATYPLVMNFGVAGELEVSGPAHPEAVAVRGVLRLPGGDVNLVATQLALDRDHANTITFEEGGSALDPVVDLVLSGGDLRVTIQGKASEWQEHLVLHYVAGSTAGGPGAAAEGGEQLDAADAARLFEDKLKSALLGDDGQLALNRLAGSTVSTLMPKIETQGQVGGTRWRLVSAPSIPGLLSLDPSLPDPSNLLSSITMGTEVEVQFGSKLQAAMVRKLRESDVATRWMLTYNLHNRLRMQFSLSSSPPYAKQLLFQYVGS